MKHSNIIFKASFFGLLFLFNLSCSAQNTKSQVQESIKLIPKNTAHCQAGDIFSWKENYRVINNQWGLYKVKKGDTNICLYEFDKSSDTLFGWTYQMPSKSYGVVAYPEIFYGTGFWNENSKASNLVQIDKIKALSLDYKTRLHTNELKMNLAMDIWVLNSPYANQNAIHTEIMIWEFQDKFKPKGKKVGVLYTPDGDYEVLIGSVNRKKMGLKWQYVAFKRVVNRSSGHIPIKVMLDYLTDKNIISKEYYIAAIEMGTELSNATGSIFFTQYDLNLKRN